MTESTDWIKPGAKVVVFYETYGRSPRYVKATTIAKVAKKSFTVEEPGEPCFSIDSQKARVGGTWDSRTRCCVPYDSRTRCCVPYDSDEAQREFVHERDVRVMSRARAACDDWMRSRTKENRLAAIAALQAVQNDEVG